MHQIKQKEKRGEEVEEVETVNIGVRIQFVDLRNELGFGDLLREIEIEGADPDLRACLALHVHVALRVLPRPHDHHREPRNLIDQIESKKKTQLNPTLIDYRGWGETERERVGGGENYLVVSVGEGSNLLGDLVSDGLGDGFPIDDRRHGWRRRRRRRWRR